MKLPPVPPQRYARTYDPVYPAFGAYNVPPGFWKRQLPTKVLDLAVRGAQIALKDHDGVTPLDRARLSGKTVAAEQLMALGAT